MMPGVNEWITSGVAVGDFNRDGWPDLFVVRGGTGYDRLFINQGNGTFLDRAAAWRVAADHGRGGITVGDLDGDRWPDPYVTSYGSGSDNVGQLGRNRLDRNKGNGTLSEIAPAAGVAFMSHLVSAGNGPAWGDCDLDGDLDLAVAAWSGTAAGNRLFRNDGGLFTDVTGVALPMPPATWGFQPAFADLDGDRHPELLGAADFGTSRLFRNDRSGGFVDVTVASGFGLDENGMGQCVGDFDGDGDLDRFVTSVFSDRPPSTGLNGNALYRNDGGLVFTEIAFVAGVADDGWGWGAQAVDLDHDGWLDIVEVNGRTAGPWLDKPECVYRNLGGGAFLRDSAASAPLLARDGDLDVAIAYNAGPFKLYRNDPPACRKWLTVAIDSPAGLTGPVVRTRERFRDRLGPRAVAPRKRLAPDRGSAEPAAGPRGAGRGRSRCRRNGRGRRSFGVACRLGAVDRSARFLDLNDDGEVGSADLAVVVVVGTVSARRQSDQYIRPDPPIAYGLNTALRASAARNCAFVFIV
jgi:hypothetical protein